MKLYPGIEAVWQGKYDVIIDNGKQVECLAFTPLGGGASLALRAVTVAAGVILDLGLATLHAFKRTPTQNLGSTLLEMMAGFGLLRA